MKAVSPTVVAAATIVICAGSIHGFQCSELRRLREISELLPLFTEKRTSGGGGMGFGKGGEKKQKRKYTLDDKSYASTPVAASDQTQEETHASMSEFFKTYNEWSPLFKEFMVDTNPLAHSFLHEVEEIENIWGIDTMENRNVWRLLPGKPTDDAALAHVGTFLDEWQRSLLEIPIDAMTREEEIGKGMNDMHFLEEGRRTIAVSRFQVLDGNVGATEDWENELFRTCWSELAHLMSQDEIDTGSLVLLPGLPIGLGENGLEYINRFVEEKLVRPISWLGRDNDWEIVAMERGNLGIRLLHKLSAMRDLSEKDTIGDGDEGS
eukprot:CAMPEP_0194214586 /NCGR_PEP_ID=MMETSP0156-20130528/15862_1 /TAXON_ID=33649 /ORGANISM="Thalassionema nitzschioides, Strain L26-B" /LENGTH=321 /DNA_ID=CAMNT_0038942877 /DNA_START=27 /DNA_END=992 /DNA_ORIENTATION=-